MHDHTLLNDWQWEIIQPLLPPVSGFGRPRADDRLVLEGILWVLRSGSRWKDLPRCFPSYATCWRRFADWSVEGIWETAWRRLVKQLDRQGAVDWEEGIADGTFASAKKGAATSARPSAAKAAS